MGAAPRVVLNCGAAKCLWGTRRRAVRRHGQRPEVGVHRRAGHSPLQVGVEFGVVGHVALDAHVPLPWIPRLEALANDVDVTESRDFVGVVAGGADQTRQGAGAPGPRGRPEAGHPGLAA